MIKVYVGKFENRPKGIEPLPDNLRNRHPRDSADLKEVYKFDFWTDNPFVLSFFDPKDVYICGEEGVCKNLVQHPKFETWKDEFDSCEMWSIFGESWVNTAYKSKANIDDLNQLANLAMKCEYNIFGLEKVLGISCDFYSENQFTNFFNLIEKSINEGENLNWIEETLEWSVEKKEHQNVF